MVKDGERAGETVTGEEGTLFAREEVVLGEVTVTSEKGEDDGIDNEFYCNELHQFHRGMGERLPGEGGGSVGFVEREVAAMGVCFFVKEEEGE